MEVIKKRVAFLEGFLQASTERSVLVTHVIFGFLFLEFGASALATLRKGRTSCRGAWVAVLNAQDVGATKIN